MNRAQRLVTMLSALQPDPEPSEADLEKYLEGPDSWPLATRHRMASLQWRVDERKRDPNLFLVPFATEIPDYTSYLDSPLWRRIRRRVLREADGECAGCDRKATEVHHRDYRPRVLAGEDSAALVALCASCHTLVHSDGNRRREIWQECERVLAGLVEKKTAQQRFAKR
jgi:5-methylcytosine-specific restriction endonuclease McrA